MVSEEPASRRTAFDVFDRISKVMLRLALQAFPMFVTIALIRILASHL
jgi:hypothetical protein